MRSYGLSDTIAVDVQRRLAGEMDALRRRAETLRSRVGPWNAIHWVSRVFFVYAMGVPVLLKIQRAFLMRVVKLQMGFQYRSFECNRGFHWRPYNAMGASKVDEGLQLERDARLQDVDLLREELEQMIKVRRETQ